MKRAFAWLCSVAPFVAAAIAALGARHDFRILWMAVVATLLAWIAAFTSRSRGLGLAGIAAFGSAAVGGIVVAVVSGARSTFGVIAVAVVIAAFASVGAALQTRESATSARG